MASIFKPFAANDMTATRTYLHEAIPITGTIISGTYPEPPSTESNCKNFAYYQAVYDYPYLSSSANHLFDITLGYSADSALADPSNPDNDEKIQIYNQFAQVLVGYDATGSIRKFDADGDFSTAGDKMNECIFIPFSRLLVKDEVQKGTFDMEFGGGLFIGDYFGSTEYKVNSPAGEYAIVYEEDSTSKYGLLYYQAGVLVITGADRKSVV